MARSLLTHTGIRTRVLLLAIVPLTIVCLILGYYLAYSRLQDLESALRERGAALAEHLAMETEFGLFSEDVRQLNQIAEMSIREHEAYEVIVRDAEGAVIARSRNTDLLPAGASEAQARGSLLMTFQAPVRRSGITIADHEEQYSGTIGVSSLAQDEVLGSVEITLSKLETIARQDTIVRNIVMMTTAAAVFSALIALLIGRGIVRPVTRLSGAVDSIRKGALDTRVPEGTGAEIGALESGFNHMAASLQRSQGNLRQEVEAATRKLALLLESVPVAVYQASTGDAGETLFITPNVVELSGFSPQDFIQNKSLWRDRIHPDDAARVLDQLPTGDSEGAYEFEYRWRIADGSYKWFYDHLRVINNSRGKGRQFIGMWQDITEFKRISKELHSTIGKLEKKNRELDVARQRALIASEEKARFLANMSHEIRTPLNAIIGYTSLLSNSNLDTDQYEYVRTVSRASTQLLRVIDDILNFSRLESGTVELESRAFDLRESFEDVVSMLSPEAQDKGLEVVLLIDSDVPVKLVGDPDRVNQVLTNLVSNAIKFTETGGINIQVTKRSDSDTEAELEVSVTDTGIGMSDEVRKNIFASFHQADVSISRRYGGTGLGLAIVDKLVALWGGSIDVKSEPGNGSTFSFTFRCGKQARQGDHLAGDALLGRKILLYDDNPFAGRAVRNQMLAWSGNVFQAKERSRLEPMIAEAEAGGDGYDLVVIGDNTGSAVRHHRVLEGLVSNIRSRHGIPILLMVNRERTVWLDRSLSDPGLGVMIKPARRELLYQQICELTGLACEHRRPAAASPPADPTEFKGLRVLLVEDNEFNRTLITTVLESGGVEVTPVDTGEEAAAQAGRGEFDAVIMDIHLPGLDGVEATKRIRSNESTRPLPVIALTADVFFDNSERLTEAGMDACLVKPLDENRMWQLLRRLCLAGDAAATDGAPEAARGDGGPRPLYHAGSGMGPVVSNRGLVAKLVAELPRHKQTIDRAVADGDEDALRKNVHELKGVAGYFGFSTLFGKVAELEREIDAVGCDPARLNVRLGEVNRSLDTLVGQLAMRT